MFGLPKELSRNYLPTYADVTKFYFWVQNNIQNRSPTKRNETVADITQILVARVKEIWINSSIAIVSHDRVLRLFCGYYDKYLKLLKAFKQCQKQHKYKQMLNSFKEEGHSHLFDIAACKCGLDKCQCDRGVKSQFLSDQISTRLMFIGHIDQALSKKLNCKYKCKLANVSRVEKYRQYGENSCANKGADNEAADESDDDIPLANFKQI
jgi:hypothetical protein